MNEINKDVKMEYGFYPLGMVLNSCLKDGRKMAANGLPGLFGFLFSDLDGVDELLNWIEMLKWSGDNDVNFVRFNCIKFENQLKDNEYKCSIDAETIEQLKKENTILFLEKYCECNEETRKKIIPIVRYSKIVEYDNLEEDENAIIFPPMPLTIVDIDVEKVINIEPLDEFEKMMLCVAEKAKKRPTPKVKIIDSSNINDLIKD